MSCILNIETSTDVCSAAVSSDGECLLNREDHSSQPNHAVKLGVFVDECLAYIDSRRMKLDAVAVSCGPGSYTGLRIGVSMAKGICYGRGAKLIAVPTLQLLTVPVMFYHDTEDDALLCPMIDARRMEVYAAVYDRALNERRAVQADIVDADSADAIYYRQLLDEHKVYFFGNGACKCMPAIDHDNACLIRGIEPLARHMIPLAEKRMARQQFEDVAYFTPFYLKDFVAKMPRNLLKP